MQSPCEEEERYQNYMFGGSCDKADRFSWAQRTPSNEGKFEVLNSLKQELKKEETGPSINAKLANVVNATVKEGLPEEKIKEKLNKYYRPENCESLTKVRVNQSIWDRLTPAV